MGNNTSNPIRLRLFQALEAIPAIEPVRDARHDLAAMPDEPALRDWILRNHKRLGLDPVWLGVMLLVAMELGLLTPPFGLLCMVMQSVAPPQIRLTQIYASVFPFIVIEVLVIALILFLPWLAIGLPRLMM